MGFSFWLKPYRFGGDDDARPRAPVHATDATHRASEKRSPNEAELVDLVRRGEVTAFETIYRAHHAALCAFAATLVDSTALGDEIVADLFLAIWDQRANWRPDHGVAAYLYRAVRNRAANVRRGIARERLRHLAVVDEEAVVPPPSVDHADRAQVMARTIANLSPERRLLIRLRWGEGLSYSEIADRLGISTAAVQMQMSRLLRILRERLPNDLA